MSVKDDSFLSVILEIAFEHPFYGRLVDHVGSGSTIESLVKSLCLHQVAQAKKFRSDPLSQKFADGRLSNSRRSSHNDDLGQGLFWCSGRDSPPYGSF